MFKTSKILHIRLKATLTCMKDRRPAGGMINPKSRKVVIYGGRWGTEGWGAVTQQTYPRYHS